MYIISNEIDNNVYIYYILYIYKFLHIWITTKIRLCPKKLLKCKRDENSHCLEGEAHFRATFSTILRNKFKLSFRLLSRYEICAFNDFVIRFSFDRSNCPMLIMNRDKNARIESIRLLPHHFHSYFFHFRWKIIHQIDIILKRIIVAILKMSFLVF